MIILITPETVVDQHDCAPLQNSGETTHEMARGKIDLAHVLTNIVAKTTADIATRSISLRIQFTSSLKKGSLCKRRSLQAKSSPFIITPRSNRSVPRQATRCTGMASSTSFASISPSNAGGKCSSQTTRGARCGANLSNNSLCRCCSSALTSRIKYRRGKLPSFSSSSSKSSASLPVPAPNSRISRLVIHEFKNLRGLPRQGSTE